MSKDFYEIALENYSNSNYSMALFAVNKYLISEPGNRPGKLLLAMIYGDLSNFSKSFEILEDVNELESDNKSFQKFYFRQMAENFEKTGKLDLAIHYYNKFIEVNPESELGYIFKGSCLALKGEYELAKEQHLQAIQLNGNAEEAYYNMALICRAEMNFEEAKYYCEKSLKIDSKDEKVRHCLNDINETIELQNKVDNKTYE